MSGTEAEMPRHYVLRGPGALAGSLVSRRQLRCTWLRIEDDWAAHAIPRISRDRSQSRSFAGVRPVGQTPRTWPSAFVDVRW